jgi:zinc protease
MMRNTRCQALLAVIFLCGVSATTIAADDVRLPAFERSTLANGAQVALLEKRDTPLVSMAVSVRGGALGDPAGKEGTAALLADLVQKGAGARSAEQFAQAIENVGGELSAGAGLESLSIGATFLARDADLMLELVADALLRPQLSAAEFAKSRTRAVQSLVAAKDFDPRNLIGTYGEAWLFGQHPYGRPVNGSEASLAQITLDDLKRFYETQVGGDRLAIAIVGDFDAARMQKQLQSALGTWRKAGTPPPVVAAAPRASGRRVLLVDKPDATQTYFWFGNVGASRTDPARTAQSVVNTVFGGRYTSMLNVELRANSGLTYGANSGFDRASHPGAFSVMSYTESDKTVDAVDLALATLDRLHREGLDADTLASSQTFLLGQFPTTLETNGQLAGRLVDLMFYGLGPDDVDEFGKRVRAVDAASVRRTIETAFPASGNLAMVMIGNAAEIRDDIKKYGAVTEMKIKDPSFRPLPP